MHLFCRAARGVSGKIRAAVLRLTHLIDNLLSSGRLIDGGAELYFDPAGMDLTAVLREVCQLHREMVPGADIAERFGAAPTPMVGDAKLLFQVFSNLLSNAVKYSPNGGTIEVEAATVADEAVVAIVDRGIGIRSSDLDRLFERYYRGGNVSGIVGTGVGLYLVKMAVDLHKGRIQVESEEGKGARFVVRLPLRREELSKSLPPTDVDTHNLSRIAAGEADAIVFFSPSAVRHFADFVGAENLCRLQNRLAITAVGPVTAGALRAAGAARIVVAADTTSAAVVHALGEYFAASIRPSAGVKRG